MTLIIGRRVEGHSVFSHVIRTHLSGRILLAVDSLVLRRNWSSSQIINQAQDFLEQTSWHHNLGELAGAVLFVTDHLCSISDRRFLQCD
jgi:hypothetical protein